MTDTSLDEPNVNFLVFLVSVLWAAEVTCAVFSAAVLIILTVRFV